MLLSGIFPPITTPFYPDGNVYYKKLEANVERYSRTPVAGIVVLGSTGEAILLSGEEQRQVLVGRLLLGYDVATVARMLGKQANAIKALQFRALQSLQRLLGKPRNRMPALQKHKKGEGE